MVVLRVLITLLLSGLAVTLIATILEFIALISLNISSKAEKIINRIFFTALIMTLFLGVLTLITAIVLRVPVGASNYTPIFIPM